MEFVIAYICRDATLGYYSDKHDDLVDNQHEALKIGDWQAGNDLAGSLNNDAESGCSFICIECELETRF